MALRPQWTPLAAAVSVAGTGREGDGGMGTCAFCRILLHRVRVYFLWSWLTAAGVFG